MYKKSNTLYNNFRNDGVNDLKLKRHVHVATQSKSRGECFHASSKRVMTNVPSFRRTTPGSQTDKLDNDHPTFLRCKSNGEHMLRTQQCGCSHKKQR